MKRLLAKLQAFLARLLGIDHHGLDEWLALGSVQKVREEFEKALVVYPHVANSGIDERQFCEQVYNRAQACGCGLAGYELRFTIYYFLGRVRGRWS